MPEMGGALAVAEWLGHRPGPWRRGLVALDTLLLLGPATAWRARRQTRSRTPGPVARAAVYREIWSEAATAVGAEHEDLGAGFAELRRHGRSVRVHHQLTPLDDGVALRLALDKPLSLSRLSAAHVPVPERVLFNLGNEDAARELLDRTGCLVVKPAIGTAGGEGVTGGVRTPIDLRRAAMRAAHWGELLIAEPQMAGQLHRVLLLDGELLDIVVDVPPAVAGDGSSTIEMLMQAENGRRRAATGLLGLELLEPDLDLVLALRQQGLTLASVPRHGERVPLKTVTNDRGPDDSRTYRGVVHEQVLAQCRVAAEVVGLRLAGIDVVAPDVERPLEVSGGVVLEVNGGPGLHRHYQVADRARATRVAEPVLVRLLS